MIKSKVTTRRIIGLVILIWMGLIFWFSSRTGVQSGQSSIPITTALSNLIQQGEKIDYSIFWQIEFYVRKSAHFILYGVLGFLCAVYFNHFRVSNKIKFLAATVLTSLYGMTDEIHQLFVPGRAGKLYDVLVDTLGGILGAAVVVIFIYLKSKKPNR